MLSRKNQTSLGGRGDNMANEEIKYNFNEDRLKNIVNKIDMNDMDLSWKLLSDEVEGNDENLEYLIFDVANYIANEIAIYNEVRHIDAIQILDLVKRLPKSQEIESEAVRNQSAIICNWGSHYAKLGRTNENQEYYQVGFEKYAKSLEIDPSFYLGWVQWGNALSDCGVMVIDEGLMIQSFEKYKKAVEIDPEDDFAWRVWKLSLDELVGISNNNELIIKSLAEYKEWYSRFTKITPNNETISRFAA